MYPYCFDGCCDLESVAVSVCYFPRGSISVVFCGLDLYFYGSRYYFSSELIFSLNLYISSLLA